MAAPGEDNSDVWVVVRCYNEAEVVASVIRELRACFVNIVGVDDGSTDGSGELMRQAGARVVRHSVNLGAGAALQTGVEFALLDPGAAYLVCFDADGQHRVSDAEAMVERAKAEDLDLLVGSRFLGTAPTGMPSSRKIVLRAGRIFERATTGIALTDAHNGLRVLSRRFASTLSLTSPDMSYATELLEAAARAQARYAEHPVQIRYSPYTLAKGERSINSVNIAFDVLVRALLGRRR
ncbi:MAG: glycosyltransferase family 2 protein [Acidimicrobiales bacterium]